MCFQLGRDYKWLRRMSQGLEAVFSGKTPQHPIFHQLCQLLGLLILRPVAAIVDYMGLQIINIGGHALGHAGWQHAVIGSANHQARMVDFLFHAFQNSANYG